MTLGNALASRLQVVVVTTADLAPLAATEPSPIDVFRRFYREKSPGVRLKAVAQLSGQRGAAVLEALAAAGVEAPVLTLGLPDEFVEHGDPAKLLALCGLDAAGIEQAIVKRFGAKPALVRAVNH